MSERRRFEHPEDAILAFRHVLTPVESTEAARQTREQVIPAIACAVRAAPLEKARMRRRRMAWIAAAACLALAGAQGYRWTASPERSLVASAPSTTALAEVSAASGSVSVSRQGRTLAVQARPHGLVPGDELRASADARLTVAFSRGARTHAGGKAKLALLRADALEERLGLELGRVDVSVPKLEPGRAFIVETPHVVVRVRGTRFTVEVLESPAASALVTRVSVTEGAVQVLGAGSARVLGPGEVWASDGVGEAAAVERSDDTPRAIDGPPAGKLAPAARARSSDALAQQNRILQAALGARSRGEDKVALRLLDELLTRYPKSPLAESARVERFRALRRLGRDAEATREARRYLAEHGEGFARDEARDVALQPKGVGTKAP